MESYTTYIPQQTKIVKAIFVREPNHNSYSYNYKAVRYN